MTLEALLRERLGDSRAMTATLNINSDRVFLDFGQIGPIPKVRLRIRNNEVSVVYPTLPASAPDAGAEGLSPAPGGEGADEGSSAPDAGAGGAVEPVNPDAHSREELVAMAAAEGAAHRANATKAEIAEAINTARAAR